ncbi:hypothetical protein [Yoonia sp. 2307UL14-13]|uniref:hypothetical protein n=1 Tax=Yoonia sp. 2307UL14-13 TaxID=3126506 RepID=UPI00309D8795
MKPQMPEDGQFRVGKPDNATDARWIYVTPEMALAHPKGQLGLLLWALVAFNLLMGVVRVYQGVTITPLALIFGVANLTVALLLAIRSPWALPAVFVQVIGGILAAFFIVLGPVDVVIRAALGIGLLVYLVDGDRPNLIYRHRFRAYSDLEGQDRWTGGDNV